MTTALVCILSVLSTLFGILVGRASLGGKRVPLLPGETYISPSGRRLLMTDIMPSRVPFTWACGFTAMNGETFWVQAKEVRKHYRLDDEPGPVDTADNVRRLR